MNVKNFVTFVIFICFTGSIISQNYHEFIKTNKLWMYVYQDGRGSHDPNSDGAGLYYLENDSTTITTTFTDGPIWVYQTPDSVKAQGATWNGGLMGGKIKSDGTVVNETDSTFGIYKVKKDWQLLPPGPERDAYETSHINWPVEDGAPWIDNNNNGIYEPDFDEPDIPGDQLLWWVSTAADTVRAISFAGSGPEKIEVHTSVYNLPEHENVLFKKYLFINKTDVTLDSMFFGYFADNDLGNAADDYVGCDSSLNLAYSYNGDNNDDDYFNDTPPALGHMLLQGPVVPGEEGDKAIFNGSELHGYKNLKMTNSLPGIKNNDFWNLRDHWYGRYAGTLALNNFMRSKNELGEPIKDPFTGEEVAYMFAGDPVTGTGWYEGSGFPNQPHPGDRRYYISSGPFVMQPGDTNEVVVAILSQRGTDRLNSVTKLKQFANVVYSDYYGIPVGVEDEQRDIIADEYNLSQNYPNPFNPSTTISFTLPESGIVKLEVFNILGERVARLVNKEMNAGNHKVKFNASGLTAGVYFYTLNSSGLSITRKMLLLK